VAAEKAAAEKAAAEKPAWQAGEGPCDSVPWQCRNWKDTLGRRPPLAPPESQIPLGASHWDSKGKSCNFVPNFATPWNWSILAVLGPEALNIGFLVSESFGFRAGTPKI